MKINIVKSINNNDCMCAGAEWIIKLAQPVMQLCIYSHENRLIIYDFNPKLFSLTGNSLMLSPLPPLYSVYLCDC